MTPERASEIVGAMINLKYQTMGLPVEPSNFELSMLSLADMVEANRIVREQTSTSANENGNANGRKTIQVNCDDRLTAAIYCALHYSPDDPSRAEVIAKFGKASVFVLDVPEEADTHCEHGIEDGEFCEECSAEYRRAAVENEVGE